MGDPSRRCQGPGVTCVTVLNANAEDHDGKRTFTRAAAQGQQQTRFNNASKPEYIGYTYIMSHIHFLLQR